MYTLRRFSTVSASKTLFVDICAAIFKFQSFKKNNGLGGRLAIVAMNKLKANFADGFCKLLKLFKRRASREHSKYVTILHISNTCFVDKFWSTR